jgi:hypothetical protein
MKAYVNLHAVEVGNLLNSRATVRRDDPAVTRRWILENRAEYPVCGRDRNRVHPECESAALPGDLAWRVSSGGHYLWADAV